MFILLVLICAPSLYDSECCSFLFSIFVSYIFLPFHQGYFYNTKLLKHIEGTTHPRVNNVNFINATLKLLVKYETMGPDFEVVKPLTELLDALNIGDYEVLNKIWKGECTNLRKFWFLILQSNGLHF